MMNLNEEALQIHKEHNGKLATVPKAKLEDAHDLSVLYTPGVAEPCRKIREDKDGWTIRTADGKPAAHYEHQVAINSKGQTEVISTYKYIEEALGMNN